MSCLSCATPPTDSQVIVTQIGPVDEAASFQSAGERPREITIEAPTVPQFGPPVRIGSDFGPSNMASPLAAARFEALDLATPIIV